MDDTPISNRGRFRFSIRSILLAITFLGLLLAVAQLWREVGPLREEVRRLRVETGQLTVDDPKRIHGFQIPTHENDTWRWRIYLPPGKGYTLYAYSGTIPATEERDQAWFDRIRATTNGTSSFSPSKFGEVTIDCRLAKLDGKWSLHLFTTSHDDRGGTITAPSGSTISQPTGDRLSKFGRISASSFQESKQADLSQNEPILVLHLIPPNTTLNAAGIPKSAAEGVVVWMEHGPIKPKP